MANELPLRIIDGPLSVYIGPDDETETDIDDTPAGNWVLVGTDGAREQPEGEGVTMAHPQEITQVMSEGGTGPVAAFRTSEQFVVSFSSMDMTLAKLALASQEATVSSVAAGAAAGGYDHFSFYLGADVTLYGLLLRGTNKSSFDREMNMQVWVPFCYQSHSMEMAWAKGSQTQYQYEFTALEDPDAAVTIKFGRISMQDAEPTG